MAEERPDRPPRKNGRPTTPPGMKFGRGIFELSLDGECLADGNMAFGEIGIEFQRVSACALPLFQIARIATPSIKIDISIG